MECAAKRHSLRRCVSLVSLPSSPRPKSDACQDHGMFFQRLRSLSSLRSFTSSQVWQKAGFFAGGTMVSSIPAGQVWFQIFHPNFDLANLIAHHTCITRVTRGLRPAKCIGDSFPDGIRLPLFGQDCMEHLRSMIRTDLNRHIDETNETIRGHTDSYLDNYGWCSLAGWKAVSITPSAGVRRVGSYCQDSQESDWT